jgi:cell wall-associated NlpC family hydrolase
VLDAARYVGLPFAEHGRDRSGVDCYGLLRLVAAEEHGIALPSYAEGYATVTDLREIPALVAGGIEREWGQVDPGQEREGDAVLLRVLGQPLHVGIVLTPPRFLHVMKGIDACVEDYRSAVWTRRVLGFYRHRSRRG